MPSKTTTTIGSVDTQLSEGVDKNEEILRRTAELILKINTVFKREELRNKLNEFRMTRYSRLFEESIAPRYPVAYKGFSYSHFDDDDFLSITVPSDDIGKLKEFLFSHMEAAT